MKGYPQNTAHSPRYPKVEMDDFLLLNPNSNDYEYFKK